MTWIYKVLSNNKGILFLFFLLSYKSYAADNLATFNVAISSICGEDGSRGLRSRNYGLKCLDELALYSKTTNPTIKEKVYTIGEAVITKWGMAQPTWLAAVAPQATKTAEVLLKAAQTPTHDPAIERAQEKFHETLTNTTFAGNKINVSKALIPARFIKASIGTYVGFNMGLEIPSLPPHTDKYQLIFFLTANALTTINSELDEINKEAINSDERQSRLVKLLIGKGELKIGFTKDLAKDLKEFIFFSKAVPLTGLSPKMSAWKNFIKNNPGPDSEIYSHLQTFEISEFIDKTPKAFKPLLKSFKTPIKKPKGIINLSHDLSKAIKLFKEVGKEISLGDDTLMSGVVTTIKQINPNLQMLVVNVKLPDGKFHKCFSLHFVNKNIKIGEKIFFPSLIILKNSHFLNPLGLENDSFQKMALTSSKQETIYFIPDFVQESVLLHGSIKPNDLLLNNINPDDITNAQQLLLDAPKKIDNKIYIENYNVDIKRKFNVDGNDYFLANSNDTDLYNVIPKELLDKYSWSVQIGDSIELEKTRVYTSETAPALYKKLKEIYPDIHNNDIITEAVDISSLLRDNSVIKHNPKYYSYNKSHPFKARVSTNLINHDDGDKYWFADLQKGNGETESISLKYDDIDDKYNDLALGDIIDFSTLRLAQGKEGMAYGSGIIEVKKHVADQGHKENDLLIAKKVDKLPVDIQKIEEKVVINPNDPDFFPQSEDDLTSGNILKLVQKRFPHIFEENMKYVEDFFMVNTSGQKSFPNPYNKQGNPTSVSIDTFNISPSGKVSISLTITSKDHKLFSNSILHVAKSFFTPQFRRKYLRKK